MIYYGVYSIRCDIHSYNFHNNYRVITMIYYYYYYYYYYYNNNDNNNIFHIILLGCSFSCYGKSLIYIIQRTHHLQLEVRFRVVSKKENAELLFPPT